MRQPVRGIARDQPVGEDEGVLHVAVRQGRDEGVFDELRVARVVAQRLAEKRRGGDGVALGAGDERREIIAGRAVAHLEGGGQCERVADLGRSERRARSRRTRTTSAAVVRVAKSRIAIKRRIDMRPGSAVFLTSAKRQPFIGRETSAPISRRPI